jgi:hypothetical protein
MGDCEVVAPLGRGPVDFDDCVTLFYDHTELSLQQGLSCQETQGKRENPAEDGGGDGIGLRMAFRKVDNYRQYSDFP